MAIIVEDGSIVAGANSYVSRAACTTYHADRANAEWAAATDAAKDAALIRATELLDASYSWKGEIASDAQALRWPRYGVIDRDGREIAASVVPTQIQKAINELALLALAGSLVGGSASNTSTATGAVKRVKAGSVEVEYRGDAPAAPPVGASNMLPNGAAELIDRLLAGLFNPAGRYMTKLLKS